VSPPAEKLGEMGQWLPERYSQ
jgi:hypothetical protein